MTQLGTSQETMGCCEHYIHGVMKHLSGPSGWAEAANHYKEALKGSHPRAEKFLEWIQRGDLVTLPMPQEALRDPKAVSEYLNGIADQKRPSTSSAEKSIELISELSIYMDPPLGYQWHSVRMVHDLSALGSSYTELKQSVSRVGPVHNLLDSDGLPIPGCVRECEKNEPQGWLSIDKIEIANGVPSISGTPSAPLPPLVTQADLDVALWLAYFEGPEPVPPSFSLDEAGDGEITRRLDRKTFRPSWLAASPFGQSMYFADWLMKSFTMRDGLPSLREPCLSGAAVESWQAPAIMERIGNTGGDSALPDGKVTLNGRLEIVVRGTSVSKATFKKWLFMPIHQYRIDSIDVFVESSLYLYESDETDTLNKRNHFRENDPTTQPGARAKILTDHYDYAAEIFPVFGRVKLILGAFNVFCQARRDGVRIATSEAARIKDVINSYKAKRQTLPETEYSPKPFHKGGCYCSGGVSGGTDTTVTHSQSTPFSEPSSGVNFLVTSGGFNSPVPDGGTGPYGTRTSEGLSFRGGSGGHGFHPNTTDVYVMTGTDNHAPRTYYLNVSGQKVDPFTGRTIDRNHPMAHIYHERQ